MDKQKFFTILYIGLIVAVISFLIFIILWLQSDSAVCMRDPLKYMTEKTGKDCYCVGMRYGGWSSP